ncbi:MAG: hypothetical protein ABIO96_10355, partial [Nitrospiraceae bacterium]
QVGDGISNLALLWFVYSITGSPVKTTMIGLLHTIPPIMLGPFIGVSLPCQGIECRPLSLDRDCRAKARHENGHDPCWR